MSVHGGGLNAGAQFDIVTMTVFILQVGHHSGSLFTKGYLEGFESFRSDNPGGKSRTEVLCVEGAEGNVFPNLQIASTPIIEESEAENMVTSIVYLDRSTHFVATSNNSAHFQFEVHALAVRESGVDLVSTDLTSGAANRGTVNDDRRGTTMVTNGQVQPVGLDSVVGATNHHTNVVGMIVAGVKVSVIVDVDGHGHLNTLNGHHERFHRVAVALFGTGEKSLKGLTNFETEALSMGSESVKMGVSVEDVLSTQGRVKLAIEFASLLHFGKVDQVITNASNAHMVSFGINSNAKRNVFQGEFSRVTRVCP